MKKENLKTIILTLLIFSSVILSVQIWLLSPVWSDTQNPVNFFKQLFSKEEGLNINDTGALNSVFSPRSFVLTYNDGRLILNNTEQDGKEVRSLFNNAIKSALNSGNFAEVTEQDWQLMLRSNSIYADYSVPISSNAFLSFLGDEQTASLPLTSFNQAVISMDRITPSTYICFRNSKENKQIRVQLTDATSLRDIYEENATKAKESYSYAFEMNLDKKVSDTNVHQTVLMNSYVLLPVEPVKMNSIETVPVTFTEETIDKILTLFGYNPKTARKYSESSGNLLFLDSNSTLKLHPDTGYIEYTANQGSGLSLTGGNMLSSAATGCGKLLDDIFTLFDIDENVTLFINSPLDNDLNTSYVISFDYLFNGNKIQAEKHSCEIHITDGVITEFYTIVKNYRFVSEKGEENALDVLEKLYLSMQQETLVIDELYTGYTENSGEMPLSWQAKVSGSNEIIIPGEVVPQ